MRTLVLAALVLSSAPVAADTYDMGVRIGGYGFRREAQQPWDECRMNGVGVFGTRDLRGPLFAEAGIDLYNSLPATRATDLPLDRMSGLFSVAIGARTHVTSWLRAYVQLGGGLELTSVSVPYGDSEIRDRKAMPEGFVGVGIDLKLARHTYAGASMRTLVMGNFDYDASRLDMSQGWIAPPSANDVFAASAGVAGQGQFYLRHEL